MSQFIDKGKKMLDGLMEKKLDACLGEDILVVMDDGLGFLGELQEYDKKTLVLKKVLQSQFDQIDWQQLSTDSKNVRGKDKKIGYANWTSVNLKEVYVRIEHVTRIWPWIGKVEAESKQGARPIYYEKEYL